MKLLDYRTILIIAICLAIAGCVTAFRHKYTAKTITPIEWAALTDVERQEYRKTKVLDPSIVTGLDTGTDFIDNTLPAVSPFAGLIPYGGAVVTFLTGLGLAWKKFKPYVAATKQLVAGLEGYRRVDIPDAERNKLGTVGAYLVDATTLATQKLIIKERALINSS